MNKAHQLFHDKLFYFLCLAFVLVLPFFKKIIPIIILAMLLNWLIEGNFKTKFESYKSNKLFFLFTGIYFAYIIGLLYSVNFNYAFLDLQIKASLLIFPLLFASANPFSQEKIQQIKQLFIYSCSLATLICIGFATYRYQLEMYNREHLIIMEEYPNTNYFFTTLFSVFIHPGYFAMYMNMALIFIAHNVFIKLKKYNWKQFIFNLFPVPILLAGIYFTASKINLILLILLVIIFGISLIIKYKSYIISILIFVVVGFGFIYSVNNVHEIKGKYDELIGGVREKTLDKSSVESTVVRQLVWNESIGIIKQNFWMGVGTGDVKDELLKTYKEKNITHALDLHLNAHNQYLQTFITLGFVGFIILLFVLFLPLGISFNSKNHIYILFLIIFIINIAVECVLETQAGTVFYGFFNSFLFFFFRKQN